MFRFVLTSYSIEFYNQGKLESVFRFNNKIKRNNAWDNLINKIYNRFDFRKESDNAVCLYYNL